MRAIVIDHFGGPDVLAYTDLPDPEPEPGKVVIEVKAFGLNAAELHMRRGDWPEIARVSGIECVGLVAACPGGEFPVGAKVAALMGGLGRTVNGSYAEYTPAPVGNVARIDVDLPWADLAAIPETYATRLPSTSRSTRARGSSPPPATPTASPMLTELGAERGEREGPDLSNRIPAAGRWRRLRVRARPGSRKGYRRRNRNGPGRRTRPGDVLRRSR
jgi:NADPH2:quinone reductase